MKYLTICRHAKSSWTSISQKDFDRTLDPQGYSDAHKMANYMHQQNLRPGYLLSSSATRARETAEIFAREMKLAGVITLEARIYEASVSDLQSVIEAVSDEKSAIMLFGHNPGLESLCNYIDSGSITALSTCNVVQYQLNIEHWKDFDISCGKLIQLATPKDIED